MNYYHLGENDQPRTSWVLHEGFTPLPKRARRPEIPAVVYRFLGPPPDHAMVLKPEYIPLCCTACGRYEEDAVYDVGFRNPALIRIKGDFSHTEDRVMIINSRFLGALRKAGVLGYETKPIGGSGWHALRVTKRIGFADGVMQLVQPSCSQCGRAKFTRGMFEHEPQLSLPRERNVLFTTRQGWPSLIQDRWIFLTEDVVDALKAGGIKGGYCNRLWTAEEVHKAAELAKRGIKWKPPKSTILF